MGVDRAGAEALAQLLQVTLAKLEAFAEVLVAECVGLGAALGEFAGKYKLSLFEALFSHSLPAALPARAKPMAISNA